MIVDENAVNHREFPSHVDKHPVHVYFMHYKSPSELHNVFVKVIKQIICFFYNGFRSKRYSRKSLLKSITTK